MAVDYLVQADHIGRRKPGGDDWLLRDVSLAVCGGQRLAIVGPTGSGKTLLLRSLALLDPIDAGTIRWRGAAIAGHQVPEYRSRVAYLHQRPSFEEGSVQANLQRPFSLRIHHGRQFDRQRIEQLLQVLGREPAFLLKQQRDLSGGEAQIVALLRVIQLDPQVLMLDEPTAALDARATRAVEALVAAWFDEEPDTRATVWVSHDEDQARRLADRFITMQDGQLAESHGELH